jgi:hypothetical protein
VNKKKYTKPVYLLLWRLPFRLSQERQWVGLAVVSHSRPANLNSISPSVFTAPWRRAKLFPRVFYTAFRLSGESSSPYSEWSYPTQTRHPSSTGHFRFSYSKIFLFFLFTRPMKMEQTGCSETSAHKIHMLANHPEERIRHSEHDESLK